MNSISIFTFEFIPFRGGIAQYTYEIAQGFAERDCRVTVLAPDYPGCEELDRSLPFETIRMNVTHGRSEASRLIPGTRYLHRHLKEKRPDVVLLTSDLAHGIGAFVCRRMGLPFVAVVHGSEITKHFPAQSLKQALQRPWLKHCYTRANAVLCVSDYVRNLMIDRGFDPHHLWCVHNGIDETYLSRPPDGEKIHSVARKLGLETNPVILTLARLTRRKGHDILIRSLPQILAHVPGARYLIVGTGEERPQLKRIAEEMDVAHAVVFAGEIPEPDKIDYLDLCSVFALPSRSDGRRVEGLGIALLEAAAREKPLIGTCHGGIGEIIDDGTNGYLVHSSDTEALAARIVHLLQNPERARKMGQAAREKIRTEFTRTLMTRKTHCICAEVAAHPACPQIREALEVTRIPGGH